MEKFSKIYKSFSFQLAATCLLVFLAATLILRAYIYDSITTAVYHNVQTVIEQEFDEIDVSLRKKGINYGLNLISIIIDSDDEKTLAIILQDKRGRVLEGNLSAWPAAVQNSKWSEFVIDNGQGEEKYLAASKTYPDGSKLLVGYSLRHVESIKKIFAKTIWQDLLYSVATGILCMLLVSWITRKKLFGLNQAFDVVKEGNLEHRAQLSGSGDQFDKLSANFNDMLGWIAQLIRSTKETADNLAHDMRTPLNRHRIRLEKILHNKKTSTPIRRNMAEAIVELDKLGEMFDAILKISKAEARLSLPEFSEFNLVELIDDIIDLYKIYADQKLVRIKTNLPPEIILKGDKQLFAQALSNLIDNAIKYTPSKGRIRISARENAELIKIVIADSGSGIPAEYHEKVKERFFRLDKSRHSEGTGLGLSLADAVVKLHHGEMFFASNNPGLKITLAFKK